ncbi:uncharacterized protein LACBIDRAFT_295063 [Laccaria bicolor S238N-H82]|uniref:Predicted protein n=1 Tax=Laccaria bicolor (strain S238N-H82 / ATCC MYA-4686) TaxID=486041 RepID=B0DM37_LACBS|nr:uncharacterized protein LACBIDRAFT_295063 [Laccaria bicolor S238N-H82]EDR04498.1 predicted protein [Laccaria bicolor S238N-H82]|eukprot:XP_001885017.1 predicted protein [Laccaria bicolor S238N-H82]
MPLQPLHSISQTPSFFHPLPLHEPKQPAPDPTSTPAHHSSPQPSSQTPSPRQKPRCLTTSMSATYISLWTTQSRSAPSVWDRKACITDGRRRFGFRRRGKGSGLNKPTQYVLNVPTNTPSNALVLLSVREITTLINSRVGEFATNPAYSLSKLHSTSNKAMAQMDGQQVRTEHDWPPEQLGGHRVGLKHPLQWFVLQDVQGRWRRRGEKGSAACVKGSCSGEMFCALERVAGRVVGVTSGVGVIVKPRRRSRAEADIFSSIGRDFVVGAEGYCGMMEGVMQWVSCPGCVGENEDGSGGEAETEGARARREEELAMAPVPPEGFRECVRESGEVEGNIDGGDDDGVPNLGSASFRMNGVFVTCVESSWRRIVRPSPVNIQSPSSDVKPGSENVGHESENHR